ncbi:hypothetical protein [Rhizobium lentis]|uniref:Cellulose biosynthesis protein BcsF n=1 Tax=Rhizobium lentis TaxID=1138194 RepID=A0ABS7IGG4_9HYPH|nr:hypothetical protein [Rhizobium lentis]MBX5031675.1 hypothetical protein [Rhizobium lentis]MBX5040443.1 hypothetical protein [Rhizobium lentis]MBX5050325.1 hypothetical protein [Rhizobium lentis]MBX5054586.1 hypothetical protein [Rhizobium lentis]MBX5061845.1 hypothetical protein [Rhizobium lentis]
MDQIVLNSAVAILIGSAFVATAITALRGEARSIRKVPVKVRAPRHRNTERPF